MNTKSTLYTIVVFSENHVGLLNQLSIIFTRRCLNIESICACACSTPGVHKIAITCHSNPEMMDKVIKQIEKRIDVIKAFCFEDSDIVYQEVALYKVATQNMLEHNQVETIIRRHGARILDITPVYTVIEKTGHYDETEALFHELKRYDLKQFMRSGRVAITRSTHEAIDEYLALRQKQQPVEN